MQRVASGQDCFGDHHGLGVSVLDFKLSTPEMQGGLFIVENTFHEKGGPARHLRQHQTPSWAFGISTPEARYDR